MKKNRRPAKLDVQEARRRKREWFIIFVTVILIVVVTYLESRIFRGEPVVLPLSGNALIFGLININIILIILLIFLIIRNLVKLIYERRRGIAGSKLRTRLVAAFVGLSLIPTVLLFLVSINFLSYSIDNWFSMRIGDALNRTLEVAQIYYQQSADQAKHYARQLSADITQNGLYEEEKSLYLKVLVERRHKTHKLNMLEVHIKNQKENVVFRDQNQPQIVLKPLSPKLREDLYTGKEVTTIEQAGGGDLIRGAVPVYAMASPKEVIGFVMASYYFPDGLVDKVAVISKTSEEYRQLTLLKTPIKFGYIVTLFIVMLLIIFSATWFGLYLAKGITVPIQDLAEATRRIAQGDLNHQIAIDADDEIGVLGESFNRMTLDLKRSKQGLEQANLDLEQRRKYTETILRNVSAGVISINRDGLITTINQAAERMLGIRTQKVLNRRYDEVLIPDHRALAEEILREMRERGESVIEKQIDLTLRDRAMTLLMTVTMIHDDEGNDMGMVVVFEDLTQLQRAERAAVWREVARRMAHEIKNPLTPVQLSAQRLQRKYGDRLGEDGGVFQECTKTIIDQVDVLKNLVNEFSRYARLPVTSLARNDLNEVIRDPVTLFQDAHKEIAFDFRRGADIPPLMFDPEQIRRVMVNLLDNAVAAVGRQGGRIEIKTALDGEGRKAIVEVADNGCGIPPDYKVKMFEPYFSTKRSGTGLGLAIVNSIIADHHGRVSVTDNSPAGTVVAFELPVPDTEQA
ncbi:MAG: HAMP domain-containing protein [Proteobacteria bacterium]|nr:HAMP domain-containing protein [Pseudomonadota bacterium]MBU2227801.1 HAMP domain-containing protein [Pseudomonadota bacterium]